MKTRILTHIALFTLAATGGWAVERIPTGAMSEGVAINPITKIAVTTNMEAGTLSVIDLQTRQLVRTIEVGGTPAGPAIETSRNEVVYSDKADNTMVIWSLADDGGEVARLPVGTNPSCVGISNDAQIAVAANVDDNSVSVVDLSSHTVEHTIPVGPLPICMHYSINPNDMTALVTSAQDGTLQVLDIATGAVLNTISVGNFPISASRNVQTNQTIVPLNADNAVAIVDLNSGAVVHTVPVGLAPACSVIDEEANVAYVSNLGEGSVSAVNMATGAVLGTVGGLGLEPQCMAFDESQDLVLVTSHSGEIWLLETSEIIGSTFTPTAVSAESWGQVKYLCCPMHGTTESADPALKNSTNSAPESSTHTH